MVSLSQAVYRLKRVPPRRLPGVLSRYAVRDARTKTRRCYVEPHRWVTLGRAYALDADPAYSGEFVLQLQAWLDDNPWPYGVNWGRAMEVAVRAVNWLWAAALFADAPEFSPDLKKRMLKALLQHG